MNLVNRGLCRPRADQSAVWHSRSKGADGRAMYISPTFEFALLPTRAAPCHPCFSRLRRSMSVIEE